MGSRARAGVTQHRTARRRDIVPHRVAADISGGGSDHLAAQSSTAQVEQEWVAFRDLVLVSPLAAAGAFLAGLAIGGFWGMGANFAQSIGLDVGGIPPSWLRFLVERSPSIGHSVGFRIECPGILSSPVRRWRPQRLPSA
jgi:hypothetical protein